MAKWTDYTEPARIRAAVTAVVALCGALGVVLPFDLPGIAEAAIVVLSVLLPLVQGEATRAVVTPTKHVVVPQTPGRPDHAA